MRAKPWMAILAWVVIAGTPAFAQSSDGTTTFGGRLSVPTIVSALQSSGYQALVAPLPQTPPPQIIGTITTGIGGAKVLIFVARCANAKDDEVCSLLFMSFFNDDKNIISDATLVSLNQKAEMAKVLLQKRPNGTTGFTIAYNYPCKGFDDTRFVNLVLTSFGADVGRVLAGYRALASAQGNP